MPSIRDFIDQLVTDKRLPITDPDVLAQYKEDLYDRLQNHISSLIPDWMPDDKIEAYAEVVETGDKQAIQTYIVKAIPDLSARINAEKEDFRKKYLGR